jgi:hypothetical protein
MGAELNKRKKQENCDGCGKRLIDPNKECPHCGTFPHKAYHETSAIQTLNASKWVQNSPVMQPNQKLSESSPPLKNIISFEDF